MRPVSPSYCGVGRACCFYITTYGKIKRPAVGWAYVVGLINVLCHPPTTPCHTFLAKLSEINDPSAIRPCSESEGHRLP
jgi:hypothetical protein